MENIRFIWYGKDSPKSPIWVKGNKASTYFMWELLAQNPVAFKAGLAYITAWQLPLMRPTPSFFEPFIPPLISIGKGILNVAEMDRHFKQLLVDFRDTQDVNQYVRDVFIVLGEAKVDTLYKSVEERLAAVKIWNPRITID